MDEVNPHVRVMISLEDVSLLEHEGNFRHAELGPEQVVMQFAKFSVGVMIPAGKKIR